MQQVITPNPNIPCQPGWCLAYVNEAFGVKKVYGSATAAWLGSTTKHQDRNFPAGVWVPVWYGLDTTPLGHVVLLAPDGSVYSTSDLTNTPHHHPDLADLEAYYAYYGMTLTYRGWTEDVEGTPVISSTDGINYSGTITPVEQSKEWDELATQDEVKQAAKEAIEGWAFSDGFKKPFDDGSVARSPIDFLKQLRAEQAGLIATVRALSAAVSTLATGAANVTPEQVDKSIKDAVAAWAAEYEPAIVKKES